MGDNAQSVDEREFAVADLDAVLVIGVSEEVDREYSLEARALDAVI